MEIKYLGHAAVQLKTDITILLDPYISENPLCNEKPDTFQPDCILLTHAHSDHLGDTVEIAKKNNITVYAMAELAKWLSKKGVTVHAFNSGGSFKINNTKISIVHARHSSSCSDGTYAGLACGFIIEYNKKIFYHSGDTALFSDMALIGNKFYIDAAMIPIGGNYTMDMYDAAKAVEYLKPEVCIPIHYNTFPIIKCNPQDFAKLISSSDTEYKLVIPGESFNL